MSEPASSDIATFARAILIGHQRDALPYLDMRITQLSEVEEDDDAAYWSTVKAEAKRQIDVGEWRPAT